MGSFCGCQSTVLCADDMLPWAENCRKTMCHWKPAAAPRGNQHVMWETAIFSISRI